MVHERGLLAMFARRAGETIGQCWRSGLVGVGVVSLVWHYGDDWKSSWKNALVVRSARKFDGRYRRAIEEARKCAEHIQVLFRWIKI